MPQKPLGFPNPSQLKGSLPSHGFNLDFTTCSPCLGKPNRRNRRGWWRAFDALETIPNKHNQGALTSTKQQCKQYLGSWKFFFNPALKKKTRDFAGVGSFRVYFENQKFHISCPRLWKQPKNPVNRREIVASWSTMVINKGPDHTEGQRLQRSSLSLPGLWYPPTLPILPIHLAILKTGGRHWLTYKVYICVYIIDY